MLGTQHREQGPVTPVLSSPPVRPSTAGTEEEEKENPEGSAGELAGSRGCGVVAVPREP